MPFRAKAKNLIKTSNKMKTNTKITGNHLLELGFKQGKWMKDAIEYINDNNLQDDEMLGAGE